LLPLFAPPNIVLSSQNDNTMELTFEQLPKAVTQLYDKLEIIEKLLLAEASTKNIEEDRIITIQEVATFTHLSVPTIYGLVSRSEIPCMKKGKRLYFSKQELIAWIKSGRKKLNAEISEQADIYLAGRRTKRG